MSLNINSYSIKGDQVELYNDRHEYVRSIQAPGVRDVRINGNGEVTIYKNDNREHYSDNMEYVCTRS